MQRKLAQKARKRGISIVENEFKFKVAWYDEKITKQIRINVPMPSLRFFSNDDDDDAVVSHVVEKKLWLK